MSNTILETLGLTHLSAPEAEKVLAKICDDHLVLERSQRLAINEFIPGVISAMHPLEREALKKRVGAQPPQAQPVTWSLRDGHDENGDYFALTATCPACRQSTSWNCPPLVYSGGRLPQTFAELESAVDALVFQHCGRKELAPNHVKIAWADVIKRFLPTVPAGGVLR